MKVTGNFTDGMNSISNSLKLLYKFAEQKRCNIYVLSGSLNEVILEERCCSIFRMNGKDVGYMPNIKPISDLRNYTEVLKEAQEGAPVFLTKNGRGEYVILDMKEYDRMRATIALTSKLEEGEQSARKDGWISAGEVEASLGI